MNAQPFYTIGHSSRPVEVFVDLLRENGIAQLVDIRKIPMSRANPQFNKQLLPETLSAVQISYCHRAALGGLRGKGRALPAEVNGFWTNDSFHNYADYALTEPFQTDLTQLIATGQGQRSALMCSEAVWWRCHRRIVADYLLARGQTVFHIMGAGRTEPARLTAGAVVQDDGRILYPAVM